MIITVCDKDITLRRKWKDEVTKCFDDEQEGMKNGMDAGSRFGISLTHIISEASLQTIRGKQGSVGGEREGEREERDRGGTEGESEWREGERGSEREEGEDWRGEEGGFF